MPCRCRAGRVVSRHEPPEGGAQQHFELQYTELAKPDLAWPRAADMAQHLAQYSSDSSALAKPDMEWPRLPDAIEQLLPAVTSSGSESDLLERIEEKAAEAEVELTEIFELLDVPFWLKVTIRGGAGSGEGVGSPH